MPNIEHESAPQSTSPIIGAGAGGVTVRADGGRNPFDVLDDLMCVIERLSPVWPPRPAPQPGGKFLL